MESDDLWQADMGAGFCPWRRRARYERQTEVPIAPLLAELSFTRGRRNWGMALRYGLVEIPEADFRRVERDMAGQGLAGDSACMIGSDMRTRTS